MRKIMAAPAGLIAVLVLASPNALADKCTALAGQTQCFEFTYSTGGTNTYRATFGAGGVFTFPDVSGTSGTWTCPGSNFLEVNYYFGGFEQQLWLARTTGNPAVTKGNGKSISNGYLYTLKKVGNANCTALEAMGLRAPGRSQAD